MSITMDLGAVTAAKIEGDIVTKTLDTLNSGQFGGSGSKKSSGVGSMSDTYNLSNAVLSAAYQPKGMIINTQN